MEDGAGCERVLSNTCIVPNPTHRAYCLWQLLIHPKRPPQHCKRALMRGELCACGQLCRQLQTLWAVGDDGQH